MDNFVRRLVSPPGKKVSRFVRKGCTIADIGCGPGYFTIPMAEMTGPTGRVYAVDSDPKSIRILEAKSRKKGVESAVEAYITSAADVKCIPDASVDFLLANGVLCCMADHAGAVAEIKRVLKPEGVAYVSVSRFFRKDDARAVPKREWDQILSSFKVKEKKESFIDRWAVISLAG